MISPARSVGPVVPLNNTDALRSPLSAELSADSESASLLPAGLAIVGQADRFALHSLNLRAHSSLNDERLLKGIHDARFGH